MRWHDQAAFVLFVVGMALLPFSTPAGPDTVVIAYGLPLLALLACTYWAVWCWRPGFQKRYMPALCCGLALFAAQTASTLYSPSFVPSAARWVVNALGFCLFLYLLSPNLFRLTSPATQPRFRVALIVFVTSAAVMAVYFIVTFTLAVSQLGFANVVVQRYVGGVMSLPWGASNVVASALIYPVFFSVYLAQHAIGAKVWRVAVRVVGLLLCLAIGLTLSRGAATATAIGALTLFGLLDVRSRLKFVGYIALIAAALVAFDYWILSQQQLTEALGGAFLERIRGQDVGTLNTRTELWSEYLGFIRSAPIFGEGYYSSLFLHDMSPHNIVLSTLVERGVVGFLMSAPIVFYAAWQVGVELVAKERRRRDSFFVYAAAGGVASLVHLMVEDAHFSQQYIVYSWVFLAIIFLAQRELRSAVGITPSAYPQSGMDQVGLPDMAPLNP